jgi:hypothetical protein
MTSNPTMNATQHARRHVGPSGARIDKRSRLDHASRRARMGGQTPRRLAIIVSPLFPLLIEIPSASGSYPRSR